VKGDTAWQGILGEIIGVQGLACETQAKKTQDIQRFADARNITPSELAVEREYEPKVRDIQNRLKASAGPRQRRTSPSFAGNLQSQYMHMQADKIVMPAARSMSPNLRMTLMTQLIRDVCRPVFWANAVCRYARRPLFFIFVLLLIAVSCAASRPPQQSQDPSAKPALFL